MPLVVIDTNELNELIYDAVTRELLSVEADKPSEIFTIAENVNNHTMKGEFAMATVVIGEWTDKHQKALEHFRDLVVERKLRELKEEHNKATATKQGE